MARKVKLRFTVDDGNYFMDVPVPEDSVMAFSLLMQKAAKQERQISELKWMLEESKRANESMSHYLSQIQQTPLTHNDY